MNYRPKILITVPRMPYPLNSGGRIAIYDSLKILSIKYDLTLIIIDDNICNNIYISELKKFADEIYFFGKSKFKCYINSIIGLFNKRPLQVGYFYFNDVQKLINNIYKKHDLFFSFMIRTSIYGINLDINKIHYSIDSMYLNYLKSSKKTNSLFWKLIYKIELPLLKKIEIECIKVFNATTFVNRDESKYWETYGNTHTLPHGVDDSIFYYNKYNSDFKNSISFIGRMDYQPNIDAVIWFTKNVLPKLNRNIVFNIIGGFAPNDILNLKSEKIKLLGFLEDPYIVLSSGLCTVAPMQTGGGLQTKILIAMAVESLVITTSLASNPIDGAENNCNILIEDDPEKMAVIINDIFDNSINYKGIKTAAKKLVINNYSLKVIESKLYNIVDKYIS
jgi:glycosyltransferase involved in cell wall biosynthesis